VDDSRERGPLSELPNPHNFFENVHQFARFILQRKASTLWGGCREIHSPSIFL
jgi:hypothetical protein